MILQAKQKRTIIDVLLIFIVTVIIGTVLILACGANPLEAYGLLFRGIFGSSSSFAEIFVKACPLILTGLGCAVAFRTGFFNIGAEGQFYIWAIASTVISLNVTGVPGWIRIFLSLAAGFVCGGLWALIAAVLKAKFNISEIIVTIMLNYIAINFLGYAVRSFLMDHSGNVPQSAKIEPASQLMILIRSTRFHAGIIIAVICVLLVWFLMEKTTIGYEQGGRTEPACGSLQRYLGHEKYYYLSFPQRRACCPGRRDRSAGHPEKTAGGYFFKLRLYRRTHCTGCFQQPDRSPGCSCFVCGFAGGS